MGIKSTVNNLSKLYESDYLEWLYQNLSLMRTNRLGEVDLENVIEELESLGRSEKNALRGNLTILLMHLLKWDYQLEKRSNGWRTTIIEHRRRILIAFKDSPSLKRFMAEVLEESYIEAVADASEETGLPLDAFPSENPYTVEQILNSRFSSDRLDYQG